MAFHTPVLMQPSGGDPTINYTEQEWRNQITGMLQAPTSVATAQGVLGASGFLVVQRGAGANFSVDVGAGKAYVTDDDISAGGTYFCWSDATFNLVTPSAPGTGTRIHRVVLQIRNKSENGAFSTYDFTPLLLQDTGSGTPAEPASAITLAFVSIAAGQASVLNANITDYRERADMIYVSKPGDTSRTATVVADDPDLQLLNLAANATYEVQGLLFFNGDTGGLGNGIQWTWRQSSGLTSRHWAGGSGAPGVTFAGPGSGTFLMVGGGVGSANDVGINLKGYLFTAAAPAFAVFQWARQTATANPTIVRQFTTLTARRVA